MSKIKIKKILNMVALVASAIALIFALLGYFGNSDIRTAEAYDNMINFQGLLRTPAGENVSDGNYQIVFNIYSSENGGGALWSETHGSVYVHDGIFNVNLGETNPINLNFSNSVYYLGIKVGSDSEMTPRAKIGGTVYSLNSEKIGGYLESEITLDFVAERGAITDEDIVMQASLRVDGILRSNGQVILGDGGDNVSISGTDISITSNTANSINFNNSDGITFSDSRITTAIPFSLTADTASFNAAFAAGDRGIVDALISLSGASGGQWTITGTVLHPTVLANDVSIGGDTLASALSVDVDQNTLRIGDGSTTNSVLNMYSVNGSTGSIAYVNSDSFSISGSSLVFNGTLGTWTFAQANSALTQTGVGQVTFSGNVDATNGLDITGASFTVNGNFSITTAGAINQSANQQVTFTGNLDANNGIDITGANLTMGGNSITGIGTNLTANGALTVGTGGQLTLGDGGDAIYINSSDWDISTTGDIAGIGNITADGNINFASAQILGGSPFVFEGTTDNNVFSTFVITDPTGAGNTITFQDASGTVAYLTDIPAGAGLWTDANPGDDYIYPTPAYSDNVAISSGLLSIGTTPIAGYSLNILNSYEDGYGINIAMDSALGTINGINILVNGASDNNYGIYSEVANATNNYSGVFMGGNFGIGTDVPSYRFQLDDLTVPSGQAIGAEILFNTDTIINDSYNAGLRVLNTSRYSARDNIAIRGEATGLGSMEERHIGIYGFADESSDSNIGVYGIARGSVVNGGWAIGIYGEAQDADNVWAGWFEGDVKVTGMVDAGDLMSNGDIYCNYDGGAGGGSENCYLYFSNEANPTDKYLSWNNAEDRFDINDSFYITGEAYVSTVLGVGIDVDTTRGINVLNGEDNGYGIYITKTGAGNTYGAYATNDRADNGYGFYGEVSTASANGYGIYGIVTTAGADGYGVYGESADATDANYGGRFVASGAATENFGLYVTAEGGVTTNQAIHGEATLSQEDGESGYYFLTTSSNLGVATQYGASFSFISSVADSGNSQTRTLNVYNSTTVGDDATARVDGIYVSPNVTLGAHTDTSVYGGTFSVNTGASNNYGIASYARGGVSNIAGEFLIVAGGSGNDYGVKSSITDGAGGTNYGGYFYVGSGTATSGYGVYARSVAEGAAVNYGIYATADSGLVNWAGYFASGNVNISGDLYMQEVATIYKDRDADFRYVGINVAHNSTYPLYVSGDAYVANGGLGVGVAEVNDGYIQANSRLGVAMSPSYPLDITGAARISTNLAVNGVNPNSSYGVYAYSSSSTGRALLGWANSATGTNYGGYFQANGTGTATHYGIYSTASGGATNWAGYFDSGNVYVANDLGVGTSPSYKLHVVDSTDVLRDASIFLQQTNTANAGVGEDWTTAMRIVMTSTGSANSLGFASEVYRSGASTVSEWSHGLQGYVDPKSDDLYVAGVDGRIQDASTGYNAGVQGRVNTNEAHRIEVKSIGVSGQNVVKSNISDSEDNYILAVEGLVSIEEDSIIDMGTGPGTFSLMGGYFAVDAWDTAVIRDTTLVGMYGAVYSPSDSAVYQDLNTVAVYADAIATNVTGTLGRTNYGLYAKSLGARSNYGAYIETQNGTGTDYGAYINSAFADVDYGIYITGGTTPLAVVAGTQLASSKAVNVTATGPAGSSSDGIYMGYTAGAMNGSDTQRGLAVSITNAVHSGASNNLYGVDIQIASAHANATETALNIGGTADYGVYIGGTYGNYGLDVNGGNVYLENITYLGTTSVYFDTDGTLNLGGTTYRVTNAGDGDFRYVGIGIDPNASYPLYSGGNAYLTATTYMGDTGNYFDTNGNLIFPASDYIQFDTSSTRISANSDASEDLLITAADDVYFNPTGNVGIGTSDPGRKLDVYHDTNAAAGIVVGNQNAGALAAADVGLSGQSTWLEIGAASQAMAGLYADAGYIYGENTNSGGFLLDQQGAYPISFLTNGTRRMVVEGDGQVLIAPSGSGTAGYPLDVQTDSASGYVANFFNDGNNANRYGIRIQAGADDGTGTTYYINAYDGDGTNVGYIQNNGGTFSLADASDSRKKTNIADADIDALGIINALTVRQYNRKQDPDGPTIYGFVAQEAQVVFPEMVSEGNDGYLAVAKDLLIPVLTLAMQDQQVMIDKNGQLISNIDNRMDDSEGDIVSINSALAKNKTQHTSFSNDISDLINRISGIENSLAVYSGIGELSGDFSDDWNKIFSLDPKLFENNSGRKSIGYLVGQLESLGLTNLISYNSNGDAVAVDYSKLPVYLLEIDKAQTTSLGDMISRIENVESKLGIDQNANAIDGDFSVSGMITTGSIVGASNKWSIDENGNLFVKSISTEELKIYEKPNGSAGSGIVKKGSDEFAVENLSVIDTTKVVVTFENDYAPATRYWIEKDSPNGFIIKFDTAVGDDVGFNYFLIQ